MPDPVPPQSWWDQFLMVRRPATPTASAPETVAVRNALRESPDPATQRTSAYRLLTLILGSRMTEPTRARTDPPLRLDRLSPEAQAAWITLQDSRPNAVNNIRATHPLDGTRDADRKALALYYPSGGPRRTIALRETNPQSGQPFSVAELVETLAHELSHGVGLTDVDPQALLNRGITPSDPQMRDRPVSAYDIDTAMRRVHQDINLPASRPAAVAPLVQALGQLFGGPR